MSEIADFLRVRIAERRALAVAAAENSEPNWIPGGEDCHSVDEAESGKPVVVGTWEYLDWDIRCHIAANDPADVIADCDAKLAIVAAYLPPDRDPHPGQPCINYEGQDPDHYDNSYDSCSRHLEASKRLLHHDYVLRLLAQPFAKHPDHKGEEWAP